MIRAQCSTAANVFAAPNYKLMNIQMHLNTKYLMKFKLKCLLKSDLTALPVPPS